MIWPFTRRRRNHRSSSADIAKAHERATAGLEDMKQLRIEAAEVGSQLRGHLQRNHFADNFRAAMGGPA